MDLDPTHIERLLAGPTESLNVELKRWIDPDEPFGAAKIIRAALALRNRNGGYLVVGFDDKSLQPDVGHQPQEVRAAFHLDKIQGLVSHYAFDEFEIAVQFGSREGQEYPVIVVPSGVRSPVAAKRDLLSGTGKTARKLIRHGDVYCRTLRANGKPSTAVAGPADWRQLIDICLDNREADIGRFLRRQLAGTDLTPLLAALHGIQAATKHEGGSLNVATLDVQPPEEACRRAERLLEEGEQRFRDAVRRQRFSPAQADVIGRGGWSVSLVISPVKAPTTASTEFLNVVGSSNPRLTGWPVWLDPRGFADTSSHPVVSDKGWQALIVDLGESRSKHVDFWRLDPRGEFFLRRVLQDDLTDKVAPGNALDPALSTYRVAEAIAVGLAFAKALQWPDTAVLAFAFRWTKLRGRYLDVWANREIMLSSDRYRAFDDEVTTCVWVSLDSSPAAIAPKVAEATRDLFASFAGFVMPEKTIETLVERLLKRG